MKLPRWTILGGTVALVLLCVLIGFAGLMPRASVARIAEAQLQKVTAFRYHVDIKGASLAGLTGIKATDIHLRSRARVSENLAPGTLDIRKLKIKAGLFSLIVRKPTVKTRIDFPSGHALVRLNQSKTSRSLDAQIYDVSLTDLGMLRDYARVPLKGVLRGSVLGTVDSQEGLVDAEIDMNILGLVIGPRTLSGADLPAEVQRFFFGEINIPAVVAADVMVRGAMDENDVFVMREFVGQGDDLRIKAEGQIVPKLPTPQSELALTLSVALDPDWVEEAQVGMILDNVPAISKAQQGDNLVFSLTGPLSKPKFAAASERQRFR